MLVFGGVTQFQAIFCAWILLCISGTLKCIKGPNYRGRFTLASQHLYSRHEYHTAPWIVTLALKSKWAQDIKSVMSRIMPPCHANIHANEAPTVKTPKDGKMVPDSGDPVQSNGFRKNQEANSKETSPWSPYITIIQKSTQKSSQPHHRFRRHYWVLLPCFFIGKAATWSDVSVTVRCFCCNGCKTFDGSSRYSRDLGSCWGP